MIDPPVYEAAHYARNLPLFVALNTKGCLQAAFS
jgi:hypothetical protein